ncbi:MAG: hypothetical protein M1828_001675 [Chrysothrix sp. TS-e1954]|nr:MAG: hypothetical protein M1828_001675 [Chrysothrix sp. TS-e1954]
MSILPSTGRIISTSDEVPVDPALSIDPAAPAVQVERGLCQRDNEASRLLRACGQEEPGSPSILPLKGNDSHLDLPLRSSAPSPHNGIAALSRTIQSLQEALPIGCKLIIGKELEMAATERSDGYKSRALRRRAASTRLRWTKKDDKLLLSLTDQLKPWQVLQAENFTSRSISALQQRYKILKQHQKTQPQRG